MLRRRIWQRDENIGELYQLASNQRTSVSHRSKRNVSIRKLKTLCGQLLLLMIVTSFIFFGSKTLWLRDTSTISRRFPRYPTHEFAQQCNWTLSKQPDKPDCTLLLRMEPGGSEGIANWISRAVTGFLLAKATGCQFYMDYGEGVDVQQVISPLSINWTIPYGFQCVHSNHCINVTPHTAAQLQFAEYKNRLTTAIHLGRNDKVIRVPFYRYAYRHTSIEYTKMFQELEEKFVGFTLETGMACSLGILFDLTARASQFESDLFTQILPTLRDERNLVVAIYIRSGQTDKAFRAEKEGTDAEEKTEQYQRLAMPCLDCAVKVEAKYLSQAGSSSSYYSKVVWMLVSDSTYLKKWISDSYRLPPRKGERKITHIEIPKVSIPREIVTTKARGVQTRTSRNPSTADFAEALIDWYLIGESDVVVTNSRQHSYGGTAALRTARPFYEPSNCSEPLNFEQAS